MDSKFRSLLFALVPAALVLIGVVGAAIIGSKPSAKSTTESAPKGQYSRDDFSKLVLNKSGDDVIHLVGRPDSTQAEAGQAVRPTVSRDPASIHRNAQLAVMAGTTEYWYYDSLVFDPVSRKTSKAQLVLQNKIVRKINY